MKKSRIIVPALAMLTLSVAASVTGTVAWFTASRTKTLTANNLAVLNTTANLACALTDGIGATTKEAIVTLTPMMDASVNVNALGASSDVASSTDVKAYTANFNNDGTVIGLTERDGNYTRTVDTKPIYALNSWKATFSTDSVLDNNLYFNATQTSSYISDFSEANSAVFKSVRVCMICGDNKIVWAPYTSDETITNAKAGGGAMPGAVENTQNSLKGFKTDVVQEGDLNNKHAETLLFDGLTKGSSATVQFIVWFEGTDSSCISSSTGVSTAVTDLKNKILNLSFYMIDSSTLVSSGS